MAGCLEIFVTELVTYPFRITISPLDYRGTLEGEMFKEFPGAETLSLAAIVGFMAILESTKSYFLGGGGAFFCTFFCGEDSSSSSNSCMRFLYLS